MYMVTIIYAIKGDVKEFYAFRDTVGEIQNVADIAKRRLEAFGCMFIASIIESIDEHFSKESMGIRDDSIFH